MILPAPFLYPFVQMPLGKILSLSLFPSHATKLFLSTLSKSCIPLNIVVNLSPCVYWSVCWKLSLFPKYASPVILLLSYHRMLLLRLSREKLLFLFPCLITLEASEISIYAFSLPSLISCNLFGLKTSNTMCVDIPTTSKMQTSLYLISRNMNLSYTYAYHSSMSLRGFYYHPNNCVTYR